MHPALRFLLQTVVVTVGVTINYLVVCLFGTRFDLLQLSLYAGFGLVGGLLWATRTAWRDRTVR